jgi:hypothetical protein
VKKHIRVIAARNPMVSRVFITGASGLPSISKYIGEYSGLIRARD